MLRTAACRNGGMVFVLKSKQRWLNHNNGGDWFVQVGIRLPIVQWVLDQCRRPDQWPDSD